MVGHHRLVPRIKTPDPILPIRLVALDIDGTLVGDDLNIGPDTRAAIRAARRAGVVVSLVTGRMVSSAMRFARELELDSPVVGYQGALIRAMPAEGSDRLGRLLVHTPMPAEVAREIVAWTRRHGLDPHLNHLERFIVRADDPRADDYSAFMGSDPELADDLVRSIDHPITKILAAGEPPLPTELAPLARERFAGSAAVTISHPRFLEFTAPGRLEGSGDPLAGAPARDPARGRPRDGRPMERHRDAGRGRAWDGHADRSGRGARGRPLCRAAGRGRRRRPDDRGALVLAPPDEARAAAARFAEEAAAYRAMAGEDATRAEVEVEVVS